MKRGLCVFVFLGVLAFGWHYFEAYRNTEITFSYLKQFTFEPLSNTYEEAKPRTFGGGEKQKRAVLLLHGYTSSPYDFRALTSQFQEAGVFYYAPQITGFGLGDFHLLDVIQPSDWIRSALQAFDLLAAVAERVDVIGHSGGGCLAWIVAQERPVHTLILAAPNLAVGQGDRMSKQLLETPLLGSVLEFVLPVVEKKMKPGRVTNVDTADPNAAREAFHYTAIPTRSAVALWQLQNQMDFDKPMHATSIYLLQGALDLSVDSTKTEKILEDHGIPFCRYSYENSAHNLFEDYDKNQVIIDILTLL